MGLETCRIYSKDTTLGHAIIVGASVRVFDSTGTTFITSGVTNLSGYFQCDLDGSSPVLTRYQVRVSKIGVAFVSPGYIDVVDPVPLGGDNDFDVLGDIAASGAAPDPSLCRCAGMFTDPGGRPIPDLIVQFTSIFEPLIVNGIAVISRVELRTDPLGRCTVDLYRKGKYRVVLSGMHDEGIVVTVPDAPSVNLVNLLFPTIAQVDFVPPPPWVVLHGTILDVAVTVTSSALVVLDGTAQGDVLYQSRDPAVAQVAVAVDHIIISGVMVGTTYLDLSQIDQSIKVLPVTPITGTGGEIDVT